MITEDSADFIWEDSGWVYTELGTLLMGHDCSKKRVSNYSIFKVCYGNTTPIQIPNSFGWCVST